MDAALQEYAARGAAGFSLNGVARRARVGKSSIYLRWPDKDSLLLTSIDTRSRRIEGVDTGSLRGDLCSLAESLLRYLTEPVGRVTMRIAVDAAGAVQPSRVVDDLTERYREAAREVLQRAVDRGEIREEVPASLLVETLYGALVVRVLNLPPERRALSDDDLTDLTGPVVDLLVDGLRAQEPAAR